MNAIPPSTVWGWPAGRWPQSIARTVRCVLLFLLAGSLPAHAVDYRTITPRVGDPFEVREGFEVVEPTLAGTDQPLPGWRGEGHIIRLADGRLLVVFAYENKCQLSYSSDAGKTWTEPRRVRTALPESARTHRPAVIEGKGCDLWVFYYGLMNVDWLDASRASNDLWVVRSKDGGLTWDEPRRLYAGYVGMLQGAIRTRAGHLVVPLCAYQGGRRFVSLCVVSTDGGEYWTTTAPIDLGYPRTSLPLSPQLNGGALEPSVAEMQDGRLLMLIRTVLGSFYQSVSRDGGLTWAPVSLTTLSSGGPCNLVELPGGRLTVAYNPANYESAGTKRWGSPIGYDRQTIALREGNDGAWRRIDDFVRQIRGKTRVVHSTLTGLPGGEILITMPERSTLLRVEESRLREQSR
jgi:hypothetical protein